LLFDEVCLFNISAIFVYGYGEKLLLQIVNRIVFLSNNNGDLEQIYSDIFGLNSLEVLILVVESYNMVS
jgi:hypothetical protein